MNLPCYRMRFDLGEHERGLIEVVAVGSAGRGAGESASAPGGRNLRGSNSVPLPDSPSWPSAV